MKAVLRTDIGKVRKTNEDSAWMDKQKAIFAVADGMGGHLAGEIASRIAIDTVKRTASHESRATVIGIERMVSEANREIFEHARNHPECEGMGTTLSCIWAREKYMYAVHVGDSRIYRFRGETLTQMSNDHSLVAELVRGGLISEAEARVHPRRNIITRALGTDGNNDPDTLILDNYPGDIWLLCSDGLHGMVSDDEICRLLCRHNIETAADLLLQAALDAGGRDNVTFILCGGEASKWKQG